MNKNSRDGIGAGAIVLSLMIFILPAIVGFVAWSKWGLAAGIIGAIISYIITGNILSNIFFGSTKGAKRKSMESTIELNQNDVNAHYNRGVSLQKSNRFQEAEKEFREAIRLNPNHVEAINDLGHSLVNLKRYEEAEKEWRKALSINPNFSPAQKNLNQLLLIKHFNLPRV